MSNKKNGKDGVILSVKVQRGETALAKKNNKNKGISDAALCAEYSALFRYVLSLTHDKHEAEDITQEAFARALEAKENFKGGSSLYTWLCSIAKNLWLNRLKKQKKNMGSDALEQLPDDSAVIEEQFDDRDSSMKILRILHTLDEPYKEVFSLRVFGQLGFKEIASLFGKTDNWACVTYHRAKERIAEKLRKDGML